MRGYYRGTRYQALDTSLKARPLKGFGQRHYIRGCDYSLDSQPLGLFTATRLVGHRSDLPRQSDFAPGG